MAKAKKPPPPGPGSSFRFDDDTRDILAALAARLGMSLTGAVQHALRKLAREEGIEDADAARKILAKAEKRAKP